MVAFLAVGRHIHIPWALVANLFTVAAVFMLPGWTSRVLAATAVVLLVLNLVRAHHLARAAEKAGA